MKKIDLHIHTVSAVYEKNFDFSLDDLGNYVDTLSIDSIAITNHNLFDLEQYKEISERLDISVFPGIEINLENGHLLLISDTSNLDDFKQKCNEVNNLITDEESSISLEDFKRIFTNLDNYILIPHDRKDPRMRNDALGQLSEYITAGEVSSRKKFIYSLQENEELVPVLFSDIRIHKDIGELPVRQTFIDLDEISFGGIKSCLQDKSKVSLSSAGGYDFIEIFSNGQVISTGLNVILGARSSGKTHTLDKVSVSFDKEQVLHIKQFDLVKFNEKEDEEDFDKYLSSKEGNLADEYLEEFKQVINDVSKVSFEEKQHKLELYLDSLIKVANSEEEKDHYAKTQIYNETKFSTKNIDGLEKLIKSVQILLDNREYAEIITSHVDRNNLISLLRELISKLRQQEESNKKLGLANNIVENIRHELRSKSSTLSTEEEDIDLYDLMIDKIKLDKFIELCSHIQIRKNIRKKEKNGKFMIVAHTRPFESASDLYKFSRQQTKFKDVFPKYDNPVKYLDALKETSLNADTYYKYFVKIEYKVLNEYGTDVSGGERSEFRLLERLKDAYKYDVLLIDEPESSFDNMFLRDSVNERLKELATTMPVVLTTHNNTVGASIQPNFLLYTQRTIKDKKPPEYNVYSGKLHDKQFISLDSTQIASHSILLDCLEAGKVTYDKRQQTYNNLK